MKLLLVIPALTAGGAERVMAILANEWAARGWSVTLVTFDDGSVPPFFPVDPRVRRRPLVLLGRSANPALGLLNNLRRLAVLRQALRRERPEAIISFLDSTNVLTLLASRGLRVPVVVAEHTDPGQCPIKPAWAALRRWLYPKADRVVVLTERVLDYFPAALRPRCRVMPNPVRQPDTAAVPGIPLPEGPFVVAMGRLVDQKGFDLLLEAFADAARDCPGWALLILGEGPDRGELEALRGRLGLDGRVHLPGTVPDPEAVLGRAELFVLSSRFEGFPMALCEAMAAGLPVVACDCPTGPREIIRDGLDGVLVPTGDRAALAAAMARLMADADGRAAMGRRAREILDRYGVPRIMALWDELLAEIVAAGAGRRG